jgi:hypothetical protein
MLRRLLGRGRGALRAGWARLLCWGPVLVVVGHPAVGMHPVRQPLRLRRRRAVGPNGELRCCSVMLCGPGLTDCVTPILSNECMGPDLGATPEDN